MIIAELVQGLDKDVIVIVVLCCFQELFGQSHVFKDQSEELKTDVFQICLQTGQNFLHQINVLFFCRVLGKGFFVANENIINTIIVSKNDIFMVLLSPRV